MSNENKKKMREEKDVRLQEALRENLRKRKEQMRERKDIKPHEKCPS